MYITKITNKTKVTNMQESSIDIKTFMGYDMMMSKLSDLNEGTFKIYKKLFNTMCCYNRDECRLGDYVVHVGDANLWVLIIKNYLLDELQEILLNDEDDYEVMLRKLKYCKKFYFMIDYMANIWNNDDRFKDEHVNDVKDLISLFKSSVIMNIDFVKSLLEREPAELLQFVLSEFTEIENLL